MGNKKQIKQTYLIGKVFNRLTVLDFDSWYTKPNGHRISKWICKCSCGNIKSIAGTSLNQGLTQSCGCLNKETSSISGQKHAKKESGFYDLLRSYKNKQKGKIAFNLTEEQFKKLTKGNCFYCKSAPLQIRKKVSKINKFSEDYIYNGIDRLDSTLPYNIENCVSCCGKCNIMKNNTSLEDFKTKIIQIYNNLKLKEIDS